MGYSKSSRLYAVPAGSTNGVLLPRVHDCNELVFYLAAGESISYTVAEVAPTAAPVAVTVSGDDNKTWQELIPAGVDVFITAKTGNPVYRWMKNDD